MNWCFLPFILKRIKLSSRRQLCYNISIARFERRLVGVAPAAWMQCLQESPTTSTSNWQESYASNEASDVSNTRFIFTVWTVITRDKTFYIDYYFYTRHDIRNIIDKLHLYSVCNFSRKCLTCSRHECFSFSPLRPGFGSLRYHVQSALKLRSIKKVVRIKAEIKWTAKHLVRFIGSPFRLSLVKRNVIWSVSYTEICLQQEYCRRYVRIQISLSN
jgi:hypothetical protein